MKAVEFTTELSDASLLEIPKAAAVQLPKTGRARVIILTEESDDAEWRSISYQQFLRDDSSEDAIYESIR
jgi:hypothetical protein